VQVRHTAPRAAGTFRQANGPASPNPHLHRAPATDSRRPPDPTSRMGPAKWRVPHVRFLRGAPHGAAWHFEAKEIQLVYRCSSSRHREGTGRGRNCAAECLRQTPIPIGRRLEIAYLQTMKILFGRYLVACVM